MKDNPPTLEDLRSGRVAWITTRQLEKLTGKSKYTWEKIRSQGKSASNSNPIPFVKDATGRIFYKTEHVLAYLDGVTHYSTAEYKKPRHLIEIPRSTNGAYCKPA